ncbi:MAG: AzlD domain-containing protein, partial [Acinetobacter sp.]|nr:AzlD domain-containing protein [Acinetobacter sp.]
MIHSATLTAILFIAATTYLTRVLGYVLLKNKTLSAKQRQILEVVPGCVLISVIAPYFV